jgi:hypothetical protein
MRYRVARSRNFIGAARSCGEPMRCSGILVPGGVGVGPTTNGFNAVPGVQRTSKTLHRNVESPAARARAAGSGSYRSGAGNLTGRVGCGEGMQSGGIVVGRGVYGLKLK